MADVAAQSDTVIIALRDDATLRDAVLGPGRLLDHLAAGSVVINVTTVTPGCAKEVGAAIEAKGCGFLDAPMTGSKAAAASGKIGFLVSGRAEVLESQRELLGTVGAAITEFGAVGNSATYKLANNQVAATLIRAIGESLALCEAAGMDRAVVMEALTATASRVCGLKRDKLVNRDWSTDFTTDLMVKDLTQALDTAAALGVKMPLLDRTRELYRKASDSGASQLDFAAVAEYA
jgi:3-hydroxyisobutyrate dehydrogenase